MPTYPLDPAPVQAPPLVRGDVLPTIDEVALLLRTRTVGDGVAAGLGGDTGPGDLSTFTGTTRPTADEVERVIDHAADEVLAQLPARADVQYLPAIRAAIAWNAAALIEASFFREGETSGALAETYATGLRALLAVIPRDVEIANQLTPREQAELDARWPTLPVP